MPWWLEKEDPPGPIRALWLRATPFLYRGPQARVVNLNLAVAGLTLVPYLQFFIVWLFQAHHILGGDSDTLVGGFAFLSLALTSAIPYALCAIPLFAGLWLLANRAIPLRVRQVIMVIQILACGQLLWMLHALKFHFRDGLFGKP
jgi:hypothetical protein